MQQARLQAWGAVCNGSFYLLLPSTGAWEEKYALVSDIEAGSAGLPALEGHSVQSTPLSGCSHPETTWRSSNSTHALQAYQAGVGRCAAGWHEVD